MFTPTMNKFYEWCGEQTKPVIENKVIGHRKILSQVNGFYDDIGAKKQEIDNDIQDNALLKHMKIKKIDLALKSIMDLFAVS
jgi:hypothetical protein